MPAPWQRSHISDPEQPDRMLKINADGSINTSGGGGGGAVTDKPGTYALISQAFTDNGQTAVIDVSDCSSLLIYPTTAGATGHVGLFQGSVDGTNWFSVRGNRTNSSTTDNATFGSISSNPNYGWKFNVAGLNFFRYQCSGHSSGTVTWHFQKHAHSTEPTPSAPNSQTVSGRVYAEISNAGFEGASLHHKLVSTASTNATSVKNSSCNVQSILLDSFSSTTPVYFKIYNKSSAPVVGTDVPVKTIRVLAGTSRSIDCGFSGMRFTNGLAYAITQGPADSDTTIVSAGDLIVNITYA